MATRQNISETCTRQERLRKFRVEIYRLINIMSLTAMSRDNFVEDEYSHLVIVFLKVPADQCFTQGEIILVSKAI